VVADLVSRRAAMIVLVSMVSCAVLAGVNKTPSIFSAAAQVGEEPVAIITPLPDFISNGTRYHLNGNTSYDTDGWIVNYTWELRIGSSSVMFLYAQKEIFIFKTLGLYKINLTVRDNEGNTDMTWTACVSVLDSDQDTLEDWWEANYFHNSLNETGDGDYDNDGYSNAEEQARETDPTVKDQQPSLVNMLMENWYYLAAIAAAIVVAIVLIVPWQRRKRKIIEKKKIKAAIEIEKALESDED